MKRLGAKLELDKDGADCVFPLREASPTPIACALIRRFRHALAGRL